MHYLDRTPVLLIAIYVALIMMAFGLALLIGLSPILLFK